MVDDDNIQGEFDALRLQVANVSERLQQEGYNVFDAVSLAQDLDYITITFAPLSLYIIEPLLPMQLPVTIIPAGTLPNGKPEHCARIGDYYDHFCTSADDLFTGTRATTKYLNTVIKMVNLAVTRAKAALADEGGEGAGTVSLAFMGHAIGQRRAFQTCISNFENVQVTNFEPGEWGERQLRTMEYLAERGYLAGV